MSTPTTAASDTVRPFTVDIPGEGIVDPRRIAQAWVELVGRLGYAHYLAPGAAVTEAMGSQAPEGLLSIRMNLLRQAVGNVSDLPADSEDERAPTATSRSRGPSWMASRRGISPGTTSLTTSRCTGSPAPEPRPSAPTGKAGEPQHWRPASLRRRSNFRSASPPSPARSSERRAAGRRRSTPTSSTFTRPTGAATSRPGRSHNCSRKRSARPSDPSVR
jgi:hypothetical protein